ncbi:MULTISPECIES: hypothetical protein [Brucella]|uniref:Uncharacterized protein n=1 Tax=Brucella pseudogrignonensis TaxID=419475 RepID=A0A256G021_9HYPH|nr:hypothetical protein [Brucella pseudogrignonensis]OYR20455.1 hypothetical protein CEV34_5605 [Brucella pseudogrignonensis]
MNRALLEMLADMEPELHTEVHRAGSDEPMRRPDHRAKKHARPMPWIRYAAREAVEMTVVIGFFVTIGAVGLGVT